MEYTCPFDPEIELTPTFFAESNNNQQIFKSISDDHMFCPCCKRIFLIQGDDLYPLTPQLLEGENFSYLSTGSPILDKLMSYNTGGMGWRSKTLVELYGESSMVKTQICYTACSLAMAPKYRGGWNRGMAYIDSIGSFVLDKFKCEAEYCGVDFGISKEKFLYSRVFNLDEIEMALDEIIKQAKERDIGVLILDSIMDPLTIHSQVIEQGQTNLQSRLKHLKRILERIREFAITFNAIIIFTNHIRSIKGGQMDTSELVAQAKTILGDASDIRIILEKGSKSDRDLFKLDEKKDIEMPIFHRLKIIDCEFLPEEKGFSYKVLWV